MARQIVIEMCGWLLHIVIAIRTHSFSYYATTFLWAVSDYRVDGIAWWTPWFWVGDVRGIGGRLLLALNRGWISLVRHRGANFAEAGRGTSSDFAGKPS